MLLIPNRYATSCQEVDDGHLYEWLGNPLTCTKDQLPAIMLATPSGRPGRGHDAIGDLTALVIEYDSGTVTIDDFATQHKDLQWFLFTTSSHTPEHHRFRVILPLAEPVPYTTVLDHRPAVNEYFAGCDPLSLCNFQAIPRRTPHYSWRCNSGEHYDFNMIRQEVAARPELRQRQHHVSLQKKSCFGKVMEVRDPARYADALWQEYLSYLWTIPRYRTGGRRYVLFFRAISNFCNAACNGEFLFSDAEIMEVIMSHTNDDKRRKMTEQLLAKRGGIQCH